DDRRRSGKRFPVVFRIRHRLCARDFRQNSGDARRLDPDRGQPDLRRLHAASSGRRLMSEPWWPNRRRYALHRLAGALLSATVAAGAAPPVAAELSGGGPQTDKNAPIVFRADEIEYDEQLALTVARGHVEIAQNGQVLLADTVSYNQRTDTVTAS